MNPDIGMHKAGGLNVEGRSSKSFRMGVKRGSAGLMTFGRSLRTGVTRAVFPEDLKVFEQMILDPQDKSLLVWNKLFVMACILAVSVDPLFLYLPEFNQEEMCLDFNDYLAYSTLGIRTTMDVFYLLRIALQFRTAFIAPSSRVFGRGELVIDAAQIAKRYISRYFFIDVMSVLPLPQIAVSRYLCKAKGADILATKRSLLWIVFVQYIPRFVRFIPLTSELKKTAGVFAESALAGAAYYLLWYLLASHIAGALWYLLAVERYDACWQEACSLNTKCNKMFLYCSIDNDAKGYQAWTQVRSDYLQSKCSASPESSPFDFGIYAQAIQAEILMKKEEEDEEYEVDVEVEVEDSDKDDKDDEEDKDKKLKRKRELFFFQKLIYCLWWGLQNLSTLGQGLETSTYYGEVLFSISIAIFGLILFSLLIGNMQTYLQSLTIRLEEMRIKRRDSEQWMHHRLLPGELRERVRRYDNYKWLETRGVDEEALVQSLPKDLRRDIKRHLCLNLVRRVSLFADMDERLLDAICERLKPTLYTDRTYIVREGDPVDEMLFIIRGRLESVTTDGGRSGFFNRGLLKEGDFCGEELLTWALDLKACANLPLSTRTVKALSEVEAFALEAEELKFVASQFRRLHSRQLQHRFRFYSQQWRTWAASFIQAAWRRFSRRKLLEQRRREEEEEEEEEARYSSSNDDDDDDDDDQTALINRARSSSFGASILAARFASNALRGIRGRSSKLQKPSEPDFSVLE